MPVIEEVCKRIGGELIDEEYCKISGRSQIELRSENGKIMFDVFHEPTAKHVRIITDKLVLFRVFTPAGWIETTLSPNDKIEISGEYLLQYIAMLKSDRGLLIALFDGLTIPTDMYKETPPYYIGFYCDTSLFVTRRE